jgi:DNA-binding SARP family transcriptional activator
LDGWSGEAVVVLDDVHEIAGSPAEAALAQFLSLSPPGLRVAIGTRRVPEVNIPRLRVSGLLVEITSDDLRFRSWEVEELFVGVFREPLAPEDAAALTRRTGGWAAGLQLFHLSTRTRSQHERAQAVADLGGRSKLVRSYLARNVLAELPAERREFLLHTSTLGQLTGPLCDALLDTTGSAHILDELEQQQLFTSSADDGRTFRYHEVLRAHLEAALVEEYGADGARSWYARSAQLLERAGEVQAAARAYARAEDWTGVARLVRGDHESASAAADLLPHGVVEHDPWLALVDARRRLRNGSISSAVDAFRHARNLLDEPAFRDQCDRERAQAQLWLATAGVARPDTGSDPAGLVRAATRSVADVTLPAVLPGPPGARLAGGIVALLVGDLRRAERALGSTAADPQAGSAARYGARLASTVVEAARGDDHLQANLAALALEAESEGFGWVARLARGIGDAVLVAQGAPAWRTAAVEDLLMSCDEAGDAWGAALLQLVVGVAGMLGGDHGASAGLAAAATRFDALDAPVLRCWATSLQALAGAVRGGPAAVAAARRAVDEATVMNIPGALGIALTAESVADPMSRSAAARAEQILAPLGLLGAVTALSGRDPGRPDPANGEPPVIVLPAPRSSSPVPTTGEPVPPVELKCFGGLQLTVAGATAELSVLRPRSRTLLRILALSVERDVHRERLVDLLWPDTEVGVATRRLQVAISATRQFLEQFGLPAGFGVLRHGDAYRLALPPGSRVDVRDFEEALAAAAVASTIDEALVHRRRAIALYRGELFPEEGPAEFVVPERERLRLDAAAAGTGAAQDAATLGLARDALAAARFSVHLDPFQDLGWQLLADLYEATGDGSAAEQARRDHARARDELEGVS